MPYFNNFYLWQKITILIALALFLSFSVSAQTQTSTKITKQIYKAGSVVECGGYIESLPVTYSANPTKKYPLIIFLHGAGEVGNGSQLSLTDLETSTSMPKLFTQGKFPDSFNVNGEDFSFIVISPQKNIVDGHYTYVQAMIDSAIKFYRIDTNRIYITGLSYGGRMGWAFMKASSTNANRIAGTLLVCPNSIKGLQNDVANAGASNLPMWVTVNNGDPESNAQYADSLVIAYNAYSPTPAPPAKFNKFISNSHDAWTRTYNPDSSWNGLNVYEWMLQYTNKKLVANAGSDRAITLPQDTVITLDGSKSTVRQGRITGYLWTKLSGPAGGTITSSTSAVTTIKALGAGKYTFELKITHTDASTARDTVVVSTQTQTAVANPSPAVNANVGGYLESLPVNYSADSTKKFPLLIFWHALPEVGNGSDTALARLLTYGPPKMINEGTFPASVTVGAKQFSFIVISPQLSSITSTAASITSMIDYAISKYRVDTGRIYLSGTILGANMSWLYVGADTIKAKRIAAMSMFSTASNNPFAARAAVVSAAHLPIWSIGNYNDVTHPRARLKMQIDSINLASADPAAKLSIIDTAGLNPNPVDSWTEGYSPSFKRDGKNVYEWMLSYSRPWVSPRKSQQAKDIEQPKTAVDVTILNATINPNPVRSSVTLWITGKATGKSSITLYSPLGQRLTQQRFVKTTKEKMSRTINVSGYQSGVYYLQVIVGEGNRRVLQFIKL